ncbi:MAG TPA: hypothetical protein VNN06_02960 [Ramlibacter sp.]|nr:hypothetical protein [Ramlibacter sp.]
MVEPLAPMVLLPELVSVLALPPAAVLGVVPVLEPLAPAAVLPVLGVVPVLEPLAPAAVLPVPGVPVLPMGVDCELCCPAPVAGSFVAGSGGVL